MDFENLDLSPIISGCLLNKTNRSYIVIELIAHYIGLSTKVAINEESYRFVLSPIISGCLHSVIPYKGSRFLYSLSPIISGCLLLNNTKRTMSNLSTLLIAHYIGLSTSTVEGLYFNFSKLIAHYIGLSTKNGHSCN